MMDMFNGAGVALVTPFKADGTIDFNALELLVNYQIKNGIDYLVALGTTAETATLSMAEQQEVVSCIKKVNNGKLPIMLGVGGNNPQAVIEHMHSFDYTGIDGVLSVTPYYSKPQQAGLIAYYKEISKESPVPVLLYNVPSRTGVNLNPSATLALANSCTNIFGVKEASGDLLQMSEILKNSPAGFKLISGDDGLILPVTSIGGSGVISVVANAFPQEVANIIKFTKAGNLEEARKLHFKLLPVVDLIFKEGSPAGIKALLNLKLDMPTKVRLPLVEASTALVNEIEKVIAEA